MKNKSDTSGLAFYIRPFTEFQGPRWSFTQLLNHDSFITYHKCQLRSQRLQHLYGERAFRMEDKCTLQLRLAVVYGSKVWYALLGIKDSREGIREKLRVIQRICLRVVAGAHKTTTRQHQLNRKPSYHDTVHARIPRPITSQGYVLTQTRRAGGLHRKTAQTKSRHSHANTEQTPFRIHPGVKKINGYLISHRKL